MQRYKTALYSLDKWMSDFVVIAPIAVEEKPKFLRNLAFWNLLEQTHPCALNRPLKIFFLD